MRYFSMFSGIGGFELGIKRAYSDKQSAEIKQDRQRRDRDFDKEERDVCKANISPLCIGYSEIDKYAIATYESHFPTHKNYGDATKINPDELPDFDMLCGGFPCQAFSIAGKRRGFEDTRGTFFFDITRIIKAKRPKIVFLENVKGLLNHNKGETFSVIIQTLSELGYDVQWMVLNSKFFGVPQNRERVFIIGNLRGEPRPEILPLGESSKASDEQESRVAYCLDANYHKGVSKGARTMIGTLRTHKDGEGFRELKEGISPTIPARAREDGSGQSVIISHSPRSGDPSKGGTGLLISDKHSFTLDSTPHDVIMGSKIRRLTPIECERLQSFPDGWCMGSDSQKYKQTGNAVTVNVIEAIMKRLIKEIKR